MCKTGSRLFGVRWTCYVVVGFLMFHGIYSQDTYNDRPEILSLHISSDIKYRFATTLVVSRVKNPHKVAEEVVFDVTLPNEAFITDFEMKIDGTVYPGEIKEKEQAKIQYETARSRGESAAHIKERPRETNKFDVQVNVAAESNVTFILKYQELLRRKRGLYHHVIYIDPGQPVQDMNVRIHIEESRNISVVRVPPLRNDINEIKEIDTNNLILIARPSPNTAFIQFAPTIRQQIDYDQNGISGQFVVEYDIERSRDAGDILVVNGYFVHFFAPTGFKPFPKDVLFIVDVSGSMSGKKIDQVRSAMATVLSEFQQGDRMDILTFSDDTDFWKNEMVNCTEENILEATRFIIRKSAFGGTNINKALLDGINHLLKLEKSEFRNPMIVFLTDGDATVGEIKSEIILENIKNENQKGLIPIFTLAFGEDADYDLLKSISSRNHGVARKIYEASDANLQITGFYDEISTALMTDLAFQYLEGSVDNATITKNHFTLYLDGSEMVVAGKMSKEEAKTVPLQVFGNSIEGSTVLIINTSILEFADFTNMTTLASIEKITEKMWAYLTIKEFMEKVESSTNAAEKESFKASALALSLKYMFVTPLTSLVVTKPDTQVEVTRNLNYSPSFRDDTKSISSSALIVSNIGNVPSLQSRHSYRKTHHRFQPKRVGKVKMAIDPGIDGLFQSQGQLSTRFRGRFGAGFQPPYPDEIRFPRPLTTARTTLCTTSVRNHGKTGGTRTKKHKGLVKKILAGKENKRKYDKKNTQRLKRYPIRIKYNSMPHASCFSIPDNGGYFLDQRLILLIIPDGITINADAGDQAQRDHIRAISIIVKSSRIDINTTAIYIVEVNNIRKYDWGNHNMLLSNVKLYVEPSKVKVEAEGLNILIYKIGNPRKKLGLFMNETTFPMYSSPSGLLATLAGGRSSPNGITILGHAGLFAAYKLTDLRAGDTWHGDSKCYTIKSDYF